MNHPDYVTQADLFAAAPDPAPAVAEGKAALAKAASKHEADIVRLIPLATALAKAAGEEGVTVANLRLAAVQQGLLTGAEQGRELSYLGAVMKRAGLTATDRMRRSHIPATHGIRNVVWIAPGTPSPITSALATDAAPFELLTGRFIRLCEGVPNE